MDREHKILRDNLALIQNTLEKFHDEEHSLETELTPVSSDVMLKKFSEGIEQIIAEKKKEIDAEKGGFLQTDLMQSVVEVELPFFFFSLHRCRQQGVPGKAPKASRKCGKVAEPYTQR